eukprot:1160598-Rhodomonas_salina.3
MCVRPPGLPGVRCAVCAGACAALLKYTAAHGPRAHACTLLVQRVVPVVLAFARPPRPVRALLGRVEPVMVGDHNPRD